MHNRVVVEEDVSKIDINGFWGLFAEEGNQMEVDQFRVFRVNDRR
jgi:hypothetical protein